LVLLQGVLQSPGMKQQLAESAGALLMDEWTYARTLDLATAVVNGLLNDAAIQRRIVEFVTQALADQGLRQHGGDAIWQAVKYSVTPGFLTRKNPTVTTTPEPVSPPATTPPGNSGGVTSPTEALADAGTTPPPPPETVIISKLSENGENDDDDGEYVSIDRDELSVASEAQDHRKAPATKSLAPVASPAVAKPTTTPKIEPPPKMVHTDADASTATPAPAPTLPDPKDAQIVAPSDADIPVVPLSPLDDPATPPDDLEARDSIDDIVTMRPPGT
jgi:hypothetical protein